MTALRYETANRALLIERLLESAAHISDALEPVEPEARPGRRIAGSSTQPTAQK
jgi:hypothetical protein